MCFSLCLPLHLSPSLAARLLTVIKFTLSVSLSVSPQASWVRGRLISCVLAVGTAARMQNTHTRPETTAQCFGHPVSIKGHMETCERKKVEEELFSFSSLECMTCPSRVRLIPPTLNSLSVKALVLTLPSTLSLADLKSRDGTPRGRPG